MGSSFLQMLLFCVYQGKYNLLPSSQLPHAQLHALNIWPRQIGLPAAQGPSFKGTQHNVQRKCNLTKEIDTEQDGALEKKASFPPTNMLLIISSSTGYTWLSHLLVISMSTSWCKQVFSNILIIRCFHDMVRRTPFYQGNTPVSTRCHHSRFMFLSLFHPIFKTTGSCLAAMGNTQGLSELFNRLVAISGSCKVLILMKVINILKVSVHSNHLLLDSLKNLKIIS